MMDEKKCKNMIVTVILKIQDEAEITTQMIKDNVKLFEDIYPLSNEEESFVVKSIESRLRVKINRGVYVKEKHINHGTIQQKRISIPNTGDDMKYT